MSFSNLSRLLLALFLTSSIAACGGSSNESPPANTGNTDTTNGNGSSSGGNGSGSSDGGDQQSKPDFKIIQDIDARVSGGENETLTYSFSYTGAEGEISVSETSIPSNLTESGITVSSPTFTDGVGKIIFNVPDLTRNLEGDIRYQFSDSANRTVEMIFSVSLLNTSGEKLAVKFKQLTLSMPKFTEQTEGKELYKRLGNVLKHKQMKPHQTSYEQVIFKEFFDEGEMVYSFLDASFTEQFLEGLRTGDKDEDSVSSTMRYIQRKLSEYNEPLNQMIDERLQTLNKASLALSLDDFTWSNNDTFVSTFIGNPRFGDYTKEDQWQFNETYAFLNGIAVTTNEAAQ